MVGPVSLDCGNDFRIAGKVKVSEPFTAGYRYEIKNDNKSDLRPACSPERMGLFDQRQNSVEPASYLNIWVGLLIGTVLGLVIGLACGHKIGIAHARVVIAEMAMDKATGTTP